MKIKSYSITKEGVKGLCKRPALWFRNEEKGFSFPIIYFQKPKYLSDKAFQEVLKHIKLKWPKDKELNVGN